MVASIIRRNLGSKALRMTFTDARSAGKSVTTGPVPEEERRRFSISDADVEELARAALLIEKHYKRPMDIEWGKDGIDGKLYILQARPERVVWGAPEPVSGAGGSVVDVFRDPRLPTRIPTQEGVLAVESADLLKAFFAERRGG